MTSKYTWMLCISVALTFNTGCAVLTKSQIRAVNDFAKASKAYSEFPGQVIIAHSEVRMSRIAYQSATLTDGQEAWKQITNSVAERTRYAEQASRADAALGVLATYSSLLQNLSSDDFSKALDESTKDLGKSLNKGIAEYNKQYEAHLDASIGAIVAAGVRGGAGIYVRHRQAKLIRKFVLDAGPTITNMVNDVINILDLYIPNPNGFQLFDSEVNSMRTTFEGAISKSSGLHPASSVILVASQVENAQVGKKLAQSSTHAAERFLAAHGELEKITRHRLTLKRAVEHIQALSDEVKSAQKLQKELRK